MRIFILAIFTAMASPAIARDFGTKAECLSSFSGAASAAEMYPRFADLYAENMLSGGVATQAEADEVAAAWREIANQYAVISEILFSVCPRYE